MLKYVDMLSFLETGLTIWISKTGDYSMESAKYFGGLT